MVTARQYDALRIADCAHLPGAIWRALEEINQRNSGGYTTKELAEALGRRVRELPEECLLLGVWTPAEDGQREFCGLFVVDLLADAVGTRRAIVTYGWIAPGHNGGPWDAVQGVVERWARARGARRLMTMTRRNILAYGRAIARRGFRQTWTIFEKDL